MNIDILIKNIREAASQRGENIYSSPSSETSSCYYGKGTCTDGTVGCIFGQVWPELKAYEEESIFSILDSMNIGTSIQKSWCSEVQSNQDKGLSWREAVERADQKYPEVKQTVTRMEKTNTQPQNSLV